MLTQRDRINLQKLLQLYNFSQLRPPPDVYQINIPQQNLFVDIGDNKKRRFIYYKVPYTTQQQQKITEIKNKLVQSNIYEKYRQYLNIFSFPQEIILKHLYAVQFNIKKCIERLQKVQQFLTNQIVTTLSKQTIIKLKSGCIYSYGHDRNMKPIVIIRADKFDYSLTIDQNYNPVYFLMLVVLGFRTVPYHAQKYINIFDLCDMNMTEIPYKYLYQVFAAMNLYYCGNTQKTYIFNAKGITTVWKFAQNLIPQHAKKKIVFVDQNNKDQVLKQIDPLQLQKKYGGQLDNLKQYWPPKCTNQQFDAVQMLKNKNKQDDAVTQSQFYSVNNDEEYFENGEGLCGSASCGNCNIF